jgi:hypothetical protein
MRFAAFVFSLVFLAELSMDTLSSRAQEVTATAQVAAADKAYQAKAWDRSANHISGLLLGRQVRYHNRTA